MLSPRAYSNDCVAITNTVVNHTLRSQHDYEAGLKKSQTYWAKKYQSVHEPFNVGYNVQYEIPSEYKTQITYDIAEAARRQKSFFYQVSLPHFRDPTYLKVGLLRYKKFLYLKQGLPQDFLVPTYDIDLMWHSHQLNPWLYKKDMMVIIGNLFNHDDNVTDRSQGSKLSNAGVLTRNH